MTNVGWQLHKRLPEAGDVLRDGKWATTNALEFLQYASGIAPGQIKALDVYMAAWYVWHGDAKQGDEILWRMGMQKELTGYYEVHGQWDKVQQIARDVETLPAARVGALWALAKRADKQQKPAEARQYRLEALARSGMIEASQRQNLWEDVRVRLPGNAVGAASEISWMEYYHCLQQMAAQSSDAECLAEVFFEMRKMETLYPELRQTNASLSAANKEGMNSP